LQPPHITEGDGYHRKMTALLPEKHPNAKKLLTTYYTFSKTVAKLASFSIIISWCINYIMCLFEEK
jgi:hypothetical protein